MKQNVELLGEIKTKMWKAKEEWKKLNKNDKPYNLTLLFKYFTIPTDWDEMANKASKNPNNEMYGLPIKEIREKWESNKTKNGFRGNSIDDYVKSKIEGKEFIFTEQHDENFRKKAKNVDEYLDKIMSNPNINYVGTEVWLFSKKLGVNLRCDLLLEFNGRLIVLEFKNIDKFSESNHYKKYLEPFNYLDDCTLTKSAIQACTYNNILIENGFKCYDKVELVNVKTDECKSYRLDYNKYNIIEQMVYEYNKQF